MSGDIGADAALGLAFLLGLRHGLDPAHIAVIDAFVFRASQARPRIAPWTGALFAAGHSASTAAVIVVAALAAARVAWPAWIAEAVDWLAIGFLFAIGLANLAALRRSQAYRPVSLRARLLPARLRDTTHPLTLTGVGLLFGLGLEPTAQAAAWGAAASGAHGLGGALAVAAAFSAGMVLTDAADSYVMARLMRLRGDPGHIRRYRRAVGLAIVVLAFGMAGYALAARLADAPEMPLAVLAALALGVMGVAAAARRLSARHAT